jgi:hypothetical protein
MRDRFDEYEEKAKGFVTAKCDYLVATARKCKRKRMTEDGPSAEVVLSPRENFIYHTFYVIVDQLLVEMQKRRMAYTTLNDIFSF